MKNLANILQMMDSKDPEMAQLGISILVSTQPKELIHQMIPWNMFGHYDLKSQIGILRSWCRYPVYTSSKRHIWIRGNMAVAAYDGKLICRSLQMMKVLHDFEKIPKTIYGE